MKELHTEIKEFTKARDWGGNHDARNLAISISLEASELLEHFQWKSGEEAVAQISKKLWMRLQMCLFIYYNSRIY